MDTIFSVAGLALLAAIITSFVNEGKLPGAGILLVLAVGALIFLQLLPQLSVILDSFRELAGKSNINSFYLGSILKVVGIAYIAEFSSQICRDIGQGALAMKVEMAGKVGIMMLAIPIIAAILNSVLNLLS